MTNARLGWIAAGVVCALALAYGAYLAVGVHELASVCAREVIDEKVSPDGRRRAALVYLDCGATTSGTTWLLIADAKAPFDDNRDRAALLKRRASRLEWAGTELRVFKGKAESSEIAERFRGTPISYCAAE